METTNIIAEKNAIEYTVSRAAEGVYCAGTINEQLHAFLHATSGFFQHESPQLNSMKLLTSREKLNLFLGGGLFSLSEGCEHFEDFALVLQSDFIPTIS